MFALPNVHWESSKLLLRKQTNFSKLPEQCFIQYEDHIYTPQKRNYNQWQPFCLIGKPSVHYVLQLIAGVLREAEFFRRFVDDAIRIATSASSNEGIRQALTSAFSNSGLELTLRQACTANQKGDVEFLDVNHSIITGDDFGFVTKTHSGGKAVH